MRSVKSSPVSTSKRFQPPAEHIPDTLVPKPVLLYFTAGVSYGFDFASLRKNRNQTNQAIVRLQPSDLRYTMGVGFDVFLRYVKFAIEFKMAFGMLDLKVQDPDIYIRSFDNLKSRTFMLSFTFEG